MTSFIQKRGRDDMLPKWTEHEVPWRKEDSESLFLPRSQDRRTFAFEGKESCRIREKQEEGILQLERM